MSKVLDIVYRRIATHLTNKASFGCTMARTGAVTLIQRLGSELNLNVHLTCMDALMPRKQDAQEPPMYFFSMVSTSTEKPRKLPFGRYYLARDHPTASHIEPHGAVA
jgi:hypothetical protein